MFKPTIAVVDDDRNAAKLIGMLLEDEGYEVATFNDAASCLDSLWNTHYDVLLVDYRMPQTDGIELLTQIKKYRPESVVVIITAYGNIEVAQLQAENRHLREELSERYRFENLVGKSLPMQEIFQRIRKVAQTDTTVLIFGETGTGKELVAKAIHYNSQRQGRFVAVNCSAIPKELVASELFGYKKGAFTGAIADRKGKFELAHGGTLFLDEVGEIPLETQVQLLRALQEKKITPLGDAQEFTVDVRLIAASNEDLQTAIQSGKLRSDLYYRLNVFPTTYYLDKEGKNEVTQAFKPISCSPRRYTDVHDANELGARSWMAGQTACPGLSESQELQATQGHPETRSDHSY
ncbi:TPA: sigma-54-dependent Fis family transcriptional regulator [Candidatus Poribacteria bacterium]|nr:sigma-54-dependent Fis family transcriptional regulator [Candidatus Poribacteria bacterium]